MTDAPQPAIDMAALSRKFALWEASATALVPQNKASLFASLASANITRVTVIFDGEGDSGQIEDIQAFNGDVPASLPEQQIDMLDLPYGEMQAADAVVFGDRHAVELFPDHPAVIDADYAEEVTEYLVDEADDPTFEHSRNYGPDFAPALHQNDRRAA